MPYADARRRVGDAADRDRRAALGVEVRFHRGELRRLVFRVEARGDVADDASATGSRSRRRSSRRFSPAATCVRRSAAGRATGSNAQTAATAKPVKTYAASVVWITSVSHAGLNIATSGCDVRRPARRRCETRSASSSTRWRCITKTGRDRAADGDRHRAEPVGARRASSQPYR